MNLFTFLFFLITVVLVWILIVFSIDFIHRIDPKLLPKTIRKELEKEDNDGKK